MESIIDSVPEHLKCPICFELPEDKVFQCRDGHIICEGCYSQLKECPQCRAPYGDGQIRNRHLEGMLDELEFDCVNKDSGCTEKLDRKTVQSHLENCTLKRRKSINICKLIGFGECNFCIEEGSISESLLHFQNEHSLDVCDSSGLTMDFGDLSEITTDSYKDGKKRTRWDIILDQKSGGYAILILAIFNQIDESISWIPLYMNYETNNLSASEIEFKINSIGNIESGDGDANDDEDFPSLTWSITPVDIFKAGKILPNHYPFRFPVPLLINYQVEGCLKVKCKIREELSPPAPPTNNVPEDITCGMSALDLTPSAPPFTLSSPRRKAAPPPPPSQVQSSSSSTPSSSTSSYLHGSFSEAGNRHLQPLSSLTSSSAQIQLPPHSKHGGRSDRHHRRSAREKLEFPNVNCGNCHTPIEKELYHCLQCLNYSACQKCFRKGAHDHLFASLKSTAQYIKLLERGQPLLPVDAELQAWLADLDSNIRLSLELWLVQTAEKCMDPGCRRPGHIIAVCLECEMKICKGCWKHGSHNDHILAMVGTPSIHHHKRDNTARKFLLHYQQQRNMTPFL